MSLTLHMEWEKFLLTFPFLGTLNLSFYICWWSLNSYYNNGKAPFAAGFEENLLGNYGRGFKDKGMGPRWKLQALFLLLTNQLQCLDIIVLEDSLERDLKNQ